MRQLKFPLFSNDPMRSVSSKFRQLLYEWRKWIRNDEKRDRRRFWYTTYVVVFAFAIISLLVTSHYIVRYNSIIHRHLESHKWALPSTIYADAPVLSEGTPVNADWLVRYLQRLNYVKTERSNLKPGQYSIVKGAVLFRKNFVTPDPANDFPLAVQFDKNGVESVINMSAQNQLPFYELEPAPISDLFGGQWEKRLLVQLKDVPGYLPNAIIAIEDRRFYDHLGIDLIGIGRALWNDLRGKKHLQGASTITQQLVKNFYLTSERTLKRKLSEALMAMLMERKITKDEVLELYMNEIYLGQRGAMSINGVGAASQLFFHKNARFITVPEAALLAGMIQAPAVYDPYKHPEKAKARRNLVLFVMKNMGMITQEQYQKFREYPIEVHAIDASVNLAPYFGDLVEKQLLTKYDRETIYKQNYRIYTTIDLNMQQMAEDALTKGLRNIDKLRFKKLKKEAQGCLIAIEPRTGFVRAFVGGRSYTKSQFDRIHQASRQPGSLFKPIVYAAALESVYRSHSQLFTPATLVSDEPTVFQSDKKTWAPKNYDNQYHGIVTLRQALANSMNVATAKLAQEVGLRDIVNLARQLGIRSVKEYPSIALGTFEASPWQLIEAYAVFANEGVRSDLRTIKKVTDIEGKTLEGSKPTTKQVLHPEVAYIVTDMLKSVMTSGTAASSGRRGFTRPAAGKTGTTDDYRDAWFVGYTPNLICLVWTGYDDNSPLRMNGAEAALPIWVDFMKMATARLPQVDFTPPSNVFAALIDADTGKLASDVCYNIRTELFIKGTEPVEQCTEYDHAMIANHYGLQSPVQLDETGLTTQPMPTQPALENRVLTNRSTILPGQTQQPVVPEVAPPPDPVQKEDQPIYFAPPQKSDQEDPPAQTPPSENTDQEGTPRNESQETESDEDPPF